MDAGYEGAVVKPAAGAYDYGGNRAAAGWVKLKKGVARRARDMGLKDLDAWVHAVTDRGECEMRVLVVSSDGRGASYPGRIGTAPQPPGGAAVGSVWRVDAAYYDLRASKFRYLQLMEPRLDKKQADCRVVANFFSNMALEVNNF
jgi:hypothetical protein